MRRYLPAAAVALAILNCADMGITAYLLAHAANVVELNALMRALWGVSPLLFVAYKLLLSLCFVLAARRLALARGWIWAAVAPAVAVYAGVVGWSVFVLVQVVQAQAALAGP